MTKPTAVQRSWVALLLFEFTGVSAGQWREDFVLVLAGSEPEARAIAEAHGQAQSHASVNEFGETTGLTFRGVIDVQEALTDSADGNVRDLYARHFSDVSSYAAFDPLAAKFC